MINEIVTIDTKIIREDIPFVMFSDCLPVKGACRSVIVDLLREHFIFIPNALYDLIEEHKEKTIKEIKEYYKNQYNNTIDEYFNLLHKHEMVFFTNAPELFPSIELYWDEPFSILSSIIDFNSDSNHDINKIVSELNLLNCKNIQIRFQSSISLEFLQDVLVHFSESTIHGIEIILPFNNSIKHDDYIKIVNDHHRVNSIIIYNSPYNELKGKQGYSCMSNILYVKQKTIDSYHCGIIDISYFSIGIKTFTESQNHNTCLNRKISIDMSGNIKNCPSCAQSFGNISNTTINEVMKHPDFRKLWSISKDRIDVCKDCEFRHMCTDCRAYIKDSENFYSQPAKCTYNPFIAKWKSEKGYVSVEECGTYSKGKGFVVDEKKVITLNKELWGG